MRTVADSKLAQLLANPDSLDLLGRLAEQPDGWATNPELGWQLAGEDRRARQRCYILIDALCKAGVLEDLNARHNQGTMRIIRIDRVALNDLLARYDR